MGDTAPLYGEAESAPTEAGSLALHLVSHPTIPHAIIVPVAFPLPRSCFTSGIRRWCVGQPASGAVRARRQRPVSCQLLWRWGHLGVGHAAVRSQQECSAKRQCLHAAHVDSNEAQPQTGRPPVYRVPLGWGTDSRLPAVSSIRAAGTRQLS